MTTRWVSNALTVMFFGALLLIMYKYGAQKLAEIQRNTAAKAKEMSKKVVNVPVGILDEMMLLNDKKVAYDDQRLINLIREYFIWQPSTKPYNLTDTNKKDYAGQRKDNIIPNYFQNFTDKGFYIECGALDGEHLSHSLYFEKSKQWSGLLVEANPLLFRTLQMKHRKAYALNACLSIKEYPSVMTFNMLRGIGRLVESTFEEAYKHHAFKLERHLVQLQCFPLYSVLLALNKVTVDFFALDVEGSEVDILTTVPFNKVKITNILAEFTHGKGGAAALKNYLESKGYKAIKWLAEDILFDKK